MAEHKRFTGDPSEHDFGLPWFYIPPYSKRTEHEVVNTDGELVATFEVREDAIAAVDAVNKYAEGYPTLAPQSEQSNRRQ